jgi:hypothetical protein
MILQPELVLRVIFITLVVVIVVYFIFNQQIKKNKNANAKNFYSLAVIQICLDIEDVFYKINPETIPSDVQLLRTEIFAFALTFCQLSFKRNSNQSPETQNLIQNLNSCAIDKIVSTKWLSSRLELSRKFEQRYHQYKLEISKGIDEIRFDHSNSVAFEIFDSVKTINELNGVPYFHKKLPFFWLIRIYKNTFIEDVSIKATLDFVSQIDKILNSFRSADDLILKASKKH